MASGAKEAEAVAAEIRKFGRPRRYGRAPISLRRTAPTGSRKQVRAIVGDRLDILVANAGVAKAATIEETDGRGFRQSLRRQCPRAVLPGAAIAPDPAEGSSVVLLSSLAAHASVGTFPAYAATKGAIDTLVKHFAAALGARGIRVNAVAPGVVATDMSSFAKTDEGRDFTLGLQALKRIAQPDDIGGAVAFLASRRALDHRRHASGRRRIETLNQPTISPNPEGNSRCPGT